jgi:hypothetical protein
MRMRSPSGRPAASQFARRGSAPRDGAVGYTSGVVYAFEMPPSTRNVDAFT